ncbi:GNAT family N-acetyltransferase [Sphingomonas sp. CJ99]
MSLLEPLDRFSHAHREALLDRAFGPDRHGRTAYRIRAGTTAIASLSTGLADAGGQLIGMIQAWPVALALDTGGSIPMTMIGPVAVDPDHQGRGIGQVLMAKCLAAADQSSLPGTDALMLIGDPEYYGRFHGFTADRTAHWRLPGPVEVRRLLARGAAVPDATGLVVPRIVAD